METWNLPWAGIQEVVALAMGESRESGGEWRGLDVSPITGTSGGGLCTANHQINPGLLNQCCCSLCHCITPQFNR